MIPGPLQGLELGELPVVSALGRGQWLRGFLYVARNPKTQNPTPSAQGLGFRV